MESHGWAKIIRALRAELATRLDTNLLVAAETHLGQPVFRADTASLTDDEKALALKMTDRAEAVAMETCAICGKFGAMSYTSDPPTAGVRCDSHRKDWKVL